MIYFKPTKIEKGKKIKFVGEMTVIGHIAQDPDAPSTQSKPKPKIPKRPKVKWILPMEDNPFYKSIKAGALAMGYETVEHEEFY